MRPITAPTSGSKNGVTSCDGDLRRSILQRCRLAGLAAVAMNRHHAAGITRRNFINDSRVWSVDRSLSGTITNVRRLTSRKTVASNIPFVEVVLVFDADYLPGRAVVKKFHHVGRHGQRCVQPARFSFLAVAPQVFTRVHAKKGVFYRAPDNGWLVAYR
jgi:hypothetical protein